MDEDIGSENISLPPFDCNDWATNLSVVRKFAETNRRWPSAIAIDPIEKRLGKWWSKAKYYANQKKTPKKIKPIPPKEAERINRLVEEFPFLEMENKWDLRFRKLELRILSARSLWRKSQATPEQLHLISWWYQQKTFVKKFRAGDTKVNMNEERAKKIESLRQHERPVRPRF